MMVYNPSCAGKYLSFRVTKGTTHGQENTIAIHNTETKTTEILPSALHFLQPSVNLYKGIEDVRIVEFNNKVWFAGNSTHASGHMRNETVIGYFHQRMNAIEKVYVIDIGVRPVKNVCPFVYNSALHLLDVLGKKVYKLDHDKENDTYVATEYMGLQLGQGVDAINLRGSTSPVHLHGNLWGFVAHDSYIDETDMFTYPLSYVHYWVEMDIVRGFITYVSQQFFCVKWGMEFVTGIAYDGETGAVKLYAGIDDKTSVCVTTTLDKLRNSR
jgi:hypothetical protein